MKKVATILIIFFSSVICFSQTTVHLDKLVAETQQVTSSNDKMEMVWWIPDEFWEESFKSDPTMTQKDIDEWLKEVSGYSIFIVVSGEIGYFGNVTYKSKEEIHANTYLTDKYNKKYYPLIKNEINPVTQNLLDISMMFLSQMIGDMGENMQWVIFKRNNHKKERLTDPNSSKGFTVSVYELDYNFKCPLGSLMPTKFCPIDDEELNGAWNYCPRHGNQLR